MADPANPDPHASALARFKLVVDAEATQREAELDDLRFVDLEDQWTETAKAMRNGFPTAGNQLPERPMLVFNLLKQPCQLLSNQQRNARLSLKFAPKGNGASQEAASAFEDIARNIQSDSGAGLARSWAYTRAIKCGRGFYRILTEYANDGDDDLDIVFKRILNQAAVYFDPYTQEPDFSDAKFCFITQDLPYEEYKRLWPDSKMATCDDGELIGIGDNPGTKVWISNAGDAETRTVRIAEYFYVEETKDAKTGRITNRVIKWCKLNAMEILEAPQDFPGRYIPVIPVIADEFNVDGQRVFQGIVRSSKDGNRAYNYTETATIEAIALAPKAPWIIAEGQLEGHEDEWKSANTRNLPYLSYKQTTFGGTPAPPPQRDVAEPPIQALVVAAGESKENVKITTGVFDPSLGQLSPSERSGKAILALQKQSEMGSSGYLDNLASMSLALEGKILKSLIPIVYGRPGRMVPTFGEDDKQGAVLIGVPYHVKNGQPVAIENWRPGTPIPEGAKFIDLTKGAYTVAPTVGKSFTTRREEGASAMTEFAGAAPQLVPTFADLWVGNMDFPGARQIADRLKKVLPPQLQEGQDDPALQLAALQQQAQQAQQLMDLMAKELEQRTMQIQTKQVESEAELTRTRLELESRERIEQMKVEAQLRIEELKAGNQAALLGMQAQIDFLMQAQSAAYAQQQQSEKLAYDAAMVGSEQDFEAREAEAGRQQERTLTGAQMGHEQQMAEQQAAQADQQGA
jgi:hypothetical protein